MVHTATSLIANHWLIVLC